ncbi:hypothetical protein Tco_0628141 [Tanacetum coccineum]|uniref:Uncharacterized protein n=1 Tax=Tanacetum coccineum TaxID=301880 RepID=A0ABQ4WPH9_9ASTR
MAGARVGVRTYLLGEAIDGYDSVDVVVEKEMVVGDIRLNGIHQNVVKILGNWRVLKFMEKCTKMIHDLVGLPRKSDLIISRSTPFAKASFPFDVIRKARVVEMIWAGFARPNAPAIHLVNVARKDDRGVTEGREDVREVFQQRGSGAKRKLSRCGRNQMGNEPILALPEGADDFVVYYDARSKDLEACLEKGEGDCLYVATTEEAYTTKYSIHPGADTMLCGFRLTNRWLSMKKDIASCGSKYLAYSEVEVEYQGSSGLLLQPELPE